VKKIEQAGRVKAPPIAIQEWRDALRMGGQLAECPLEVLELQKVIEKNLV
jgi:hypothetical protein